MKNITSIIRRQLTYLSKQKSVKSYSITPQGLQRFIELKPRSQKLLTDLLAMIGPTCHLDSVTLDVNYTQLGFNHSRNFYQYRDDLASKRMIFVKDNLIFINPTFVNYLNHRQKSTFFNEFKLNQPKAVNMGKPVLHLKIG